jgi:Family of unknown function (DUF5947)
MSRGLAELRRLVRPRPAEERCELCATRLDERHEHLVEPRKRRLLCSCIACAILFDGTVETPYRRVPRDVVRLPGFRLTDETWNGLAIPIGLAFLLRNSVSNEIAALYPSAAGPAETILDVGSWQELAMENRQLERLRPDVEALLINRLNGAREYYLAPIDECYRLTGIIRTCWRGFSGGSEAEERIRAFFADLDRRAEVGPVEAYA